MSWLRVWTPETECELKSYLCFSLAECSYISIIVTTRMRHNKQRQILSGVNNSFYAHESMG